MEFGSFIKLTLLLMYIDEPFPNTTVPPLPKPDPTRKYFAPRQEKAN